jgi:ribonuclease PH
MRHDSRKPDERALTFKRRYTRSPGSVLAYGLHHRACTCTVEPTVPPRLVGSGKGWLTAEHGMLPGSTSSRKRDRGGKVDGRTVEIRAFPSAAAFAPSWIWGSRRTLWIDCDVIEADGGTRTASINGAFVRAGGRPGRREQEREKALPGAGEVVATASRR